MRSIIDKLNFRAIFALSSLMGLFACSQGGAGIFGIGAPTQTSDDVAHIFNDVSGLSEKVGNLCNLLKVRGNQPNLNGISVANDVCTSPASSAVNYDALGKSLAFTSFFGEGSGTGDNSVLSINTRSEVWLNRSLLQLAQTVVGSLEKETNNVLGQGGQSSSKNEDFQFEVLGKPNFDSQNFTFSLEFVIRSTREQNGQIDINNQFKVTGQMFDNRYFAATAQTLAPADFKQSILKEGKFLILIVPHSGDVFIDISSNLIFHSVGVDKAFESQIKTALEPGLKSIPDLLAKLEEDQPTQ